MNYCFTFLSWMALAIYVMGGLICACKHWSITYLQDPRFAMYLFRQVGRILGTIIVFILWPLFYGMNCIIAERLVGYHELFR